MVAVLIVEADVESEVALMETIISLKSSARFITSGGFCTATCDMRLLGGVTKEEGWFILARLFSALTSSKGLPGGVNEGDLVG